MSALSNIQGMLNNLASNVNKIYLMIQDHAIRLRKIEETSSGLTTSDITNIVVASMPKQRESMTTEQIKMLVDAKVNDAITRTTLSSDDITPTKTSKKKPVTLKKAVTADACIDECDP